MVNMWRILFNLFRGWPISLVILLLLNFIIILWIRTFCLSFLYLNKPCFCLFPLQHIISSYDFEIQIVMVFEWAGDFWQHLNSSGKKKSDFACYYFCLWNVFDVFCQNCILFFLILCPAKRLFLKIRFYTHSFFFLINICTPKCWLKFNSFCVQFIATSQQRLSKYIIFMF